VGPIRNAWLEEFFTWVEPYIDHRHGLIFWL